MMKKHRHVKGDLKHTLEIGNASRRHTFPVPVPASQCPKSVPVPTVAPGVHSIYNR